MQALPNQDVVRVGYIFRDRRKARLGGQAGFQKGREGLQPGLRELEGWVGGRVRV